MQLTQQQKDFLIELGKTDIETRKAFPELFEIKEGVWYVHANNEHPLWMSMVVGGVIYGFNLMGDWYSCEDDGYIYEQNMVEASPETVKSALIAEAKKRYKVGDVIDRANFDDELGAAKIDTSSFPHDGDFYYSDSENYLEFHGFVVFSSRQWASVITPAPSIEDDIKTLREKYPDYCLTIIVEKK